MASMEQEARRIACATIVAMCMAGAANAQQLNFQLIGGGVVGDGGPATSGNLVGASDLLRDPSGNLYISEYAGNRIRKVAPDGTITTLVGGTTGFSGDGGPASAARINGPKGLARDAAGNLYFSDSRNHRVRRIDGAGTITTVVGRGTGANDGDNGPAGNAAMKVPSGLAIDGAGNLYVADELSNVVRKVAPDGTITTVAGMGALTGYTGDGGPATEATLAHPMGLDVDAAGNLYIADMVNSAIRKVDTSGTITTALYEDLMQPSNVAIGPDGALYTSYYNGCEFYKLLNGVKTVVTGDDSCEERGDGGMASLASSGAIDGVAFDETGGIYLADAEYSRVRRIGSDGIITTVVGRKRDFDDGTPALQVPLSWGLGIAASPTGAVAFNDAMWERRVLEIKAGNMWWRAGNGRELTSCSTPCLAKEIALRVPWGIAYAPDGAIYVADRALRRVYAIDAGGVISVIAGGASYVGDGPAPATSLSIDPHGIAVDDEGILYLADKKNHRLRMVDGTGTMSVVTNTTLPTAVAIDAGNLYWVSSDHQILKRDALGTITYIAGDGTEFDYNEGGAATGTGMAEVFGLAAANGEVYYSTHGLIRRIAVDGTVHTISGWNDYARGLAITGNVLYVTGQSGSIYRAPIQVVRRPAHDYNGDGRSDILWHHAQTGQNVAWSSANAATQQAITGVTSLAWKIVGQGDFDKDGKDDLVWRNTQTGQNTLWRSANSNTPIPVATAALAWSVVGVGDIDGDGAADLVWRNGTNGQNAIWRFGNVNTPIATTAVTNTQWRIVGVGDFDGDRKDDLLWRNVANGQNAIWRAGKLAFPQTVATVADLAWKVQGVGDFDGDGFADIFWRNTRTGANAIWRKGNSAKPIATTGVTSQDWQVQAVGDYNGDGKSDLLWRNGKTGQNVIWRSGSSTTQLGVTGVTNVQWQIVPHENQP